VSLSSKKEQQIALARDRVAVHRQKRAKVDCREQLDGQLAEEDTDAAMHDGEYYYGMFLCCAASNTIKTVQLVLHFFLVDLFIRRNLNFTWKYSALS
jgi:hypothetical protein